MESAENSVALRGTFLQKIYRWTPLIFFAGVMILYLTMLTDFVFVDEVDVFYGGYNVVNSGDIYKVYPTQHMPFSYYMSAFIALFGATTAYQFRLGFFVMLSGLWTGIYVHHRKHLNNWALLGLPFFYVFQLKQHSLATAMISDHWQGIGLVILILEVLRYRKTWRIPTSVAVFVSLGIVLSFGTAFISAFSVFAVFVGVAVMQFLRLRKHPEERQTALREDLRLVAIAFAPFVALGLWYLISGNLANAVGGAYTLNVDIYSRYIGGFGAEAGGAFLSSFPGWVRYFLKGFQSLGSNPVFGITAIIQNVALVAFCVLVMRDNPVAGITVLLASILAGVRAFDGFHGAPYMAVCSVPMAYWLGTALLRIFEKRTVARAVSLVGALGMVVLLVAPAARDVYHLLYIPQYLAPRTVAATNEITLEVLTDDGDRILTGDLSASSGTIMRNHLRLAECSTATGNPWFYEFYGERELENLKKEKTRILRFSPEDELWGYKLREYGADFVQYVEENYQQIDDSLFVRKDTLGETSARLREAGYGLIDLREPLRDYGGLGEQLRPGDTMEEQFTALGSEVTAALVKTANYFGGNKIGLKCELIDEETGEVLAETRYDKSQMRDNDFVRFPLGAEVVPGGRYVIRMTAEGEVGENEESKLHIYRSGDGEMAMRIEYGIDDECRIKGMK